LQQVTQETPAYPERSPRLGGVGPPGGMNKNYNNKRPLSRNYINTTLNIAEGYHYV